MSLKFQGLSANGWPTYYCTECQAEWQIQPGNQLDDHSVEDCLAIQKQNADLQTLSKAMPGQEFAFSTRYNKWVPI